MDKVETQTSRTQFAFVRLDITPPEDIYHGLWGAAPQHAATGIHKNIFADILVFQKLGDSSQSVIMILLDHVMFEESQQEMIKEKVQNISDNLKILVTFSHTHSAGFMYSDRVKFPGGEKINPYLELTRDNIKEATKKALDQLEDVTITFEYGQCGLATNRDYKDRKRDQFVCGFNPEVIPDQTLLVGRVSDANDRILCNLVHYGCHPTTLAWENTLISPDYVGEMRETMEKVTAVPSIFILGACGDLGPKHGFVRDTEVADKNGRSLGYSALSILETMGPSGKDYHYTGPVVSGATLGIWDYFSQDTVRLKKTTIFKCIEKHVFLPIKKIKNRETLLSEIEKFKISLEKAENNNEDLMCRDFEAEIERNRRWLGRIETLPKNRKYKFNYTVLRLGDAFWVLCGGEPYSEIQSILRDKFKDYVIIFSPLSGPNVGYLFPENRFGLGLYQEEASIFNRDHFELLVSSIQSTIEELIDA
jgi:hypothetical protein